VAAGGGGVERQMGGAEETENSSALSRRSYGHMVESKDQHFTVTRRLSAMRGIAPQNAPLNVRRGRRRRAITARQTETAAAFAAPFAACNARRIAALVRM